MNVYSDIRTLVVETLDVMVVDGELPNGLDYGTVSVEPPRDPAHGDMATNAALVLAKPADMNPRADRRRAGRAAARRSAHRSRSTSRGRAS